MKIGKISPKVKGAQLRAEVNKAMNPDKPQQTNKKK